MKGYLPKLPDYGSSQILVCGQITIKVQRHNQQATFPLVLVKQEGPPLLGEN